MENNQSEKGNMCMCNHGSCGCGHSHKHFIKWLVKIAFAVVIFSLGFVMGEMKGMLVESGFSNFHHGEMMYGGGNYSYGNFQPMMDGTNAVGGASTTPDATTNLSAPAKK